MPKFTRTAQELAALNKALQAVSKCKPTKREIALKLVDAQVAIDKALEPFELKRKNLVKEYPKPPEQGAAPEAQVAYQTERNQVDQKFQDMYENEGFEVKLPSPLKRDDISGFQEMPNPSDLAQLVPWMFPEAVEEK